VSSAALERLARHRRHVCHDRGAALGGGLGAGLDAWVLTLNSAKAPPARLA